MSGAIASSKSRQNALDVFWQDFDDALRTKSKLKREERNNITIYGWPAVEHKVAFEMAARERMEHSKSRITKSIVVVI